MSCGCDLKTHDADVHHLLPRSMGGSDEPSNLVALCDGCHASHHPNLAGGLARRALEYWAVRLALWLDRQGTISEASHLGPALRLFGLRRFRSGQLPIVLAALSGKSALVVSPTGSGKTLAAFLICIDDLVRGGFDAELPETTQVLYVSPLKALSNDIQKNLRQPLAEIGAAALQAGLLMPELRVLVRTGDTPMADRQQMLKRPPHILVTTPESLFILLTAEKSRRLLQTVRTVIVDEIHALAPNKRGSHLALSLERLASRAGLSRFHLQRTFKTLVDRV